MDESQQRQNLHDRANEMLAEVETSVGREPSKVDVAVFCLAVSDRRAAILERRVAEATDSVDALRKANRRLDERLEALDGELREAKQIAASAQQHAERLMSQGGGPTDQVRQLQGIVHELATHDFPLTDVEAEARCALCRTVVPDDTEDWDATGWHTPQCLWRRSRELELAA
jgi:chromosome segregation ATPase